MQNYYSQFHDGNFDGVWVEGKEARLLLTSNDHHAFVLIATGVRAMFVDGFRLGNIVFDIEVHDGPSVSIQKIADVYQLPSTQDGEKKAVELFERACQQKLKLLEVSASYGGTCLILAASFDLIERSSWLAAISNPKMPMNQS
jgi:hypothetical protein